MTQPAPQLEGFFRAFERSSDAGDFPALVSQFSDPFMVAGPGGAQCVRAADFAVALPKRKQFFDQLGCRATTLIALDETPVDSRYVLAKTRWQMTFQQGDQTKDAMADSAFLVDTAAEPFRIVFYLPNQDYMTMLREQGILPS